MHLAKQANIKKKLGRKFPASKYKVYSYNKPTAQLLIAQSIALRWRIELVKQISKLFAFEARKNTFGENFVFFICNLKQLDNCLSTLAGVGLRTKNFQFLVLSHRLSVSSSYKRISNSNHTSSAFISSCPCRISTNCWVI